MIITDPYMTRKDGVVLNRTYSDKNMMIERNGVLYSEAIDPANLKRVYTETDIPVAEYDEKEVIPVEETMSMQEMQEKLRLLELKLMSL